MLTLALKRFAISVGLGLHSGAWEVTLPGVAERVLRGLVWAEAGTDAAFDTLTVNGRLQTQKWNVQLIIRRTTLLVPFILRSTNGCITEKLLYH